MTLSVIIPTRNEAQTIGPLVESLFRYGGEALVEVLVADGGSTDGTPERARQAGARVWTAPEPGRAVQMNGAARLARGTVLYFVHADVQIHPDFATDIRQALAAGYLAGCYRFQFDSPHPLLRLNSFGTRFSGLMSRGGDQTLFVTRALFDQLGGFDERFVIMEDFDLIRRIRRDAPFRIIPKNVIVSSRKYSTNGWVRVQLANLTAFALFYLRISPRQIARTYRALLNAH
jgi:rSAM/selenodomain-associated transferase 2